MPVRLYAKFVSLLHVLLLASGILCAQEVRQDEDGEIFEELPASFGLTAGLNFNKLVLPKNYDGDIQDPDWSSSASTLTLGLTYEKPIYVLDLSLYTNLLLSKSSYSTSSRSQSVDTDVLIDLTSLDAALLLRRNFGDRELRPYLYAGGILSYHIENSGKIYKASVQSNEVVIAYLAHRPLIADFSIGYGVGAGVKKMLGTKTRGISLEARYTSVGHTKEYVSCNQFSILAGFTF